MMKTVWMFPGQGSQSARMGARFSALAPFAEMIARIEAATNQPVRALIETCPADELMRTDRAQLAIFTMSMGIWANLVAAGHQPSLVAGHSLGHISALVASDVMTVEDGAKLVAARGRLMRSGGTRVEGGMGVVQGLQGDRIAHLLAQEKLRVWVANRNLADQTVISGAVADLPAARELLMKAGGRWVALNVSGAFHSPLLSPEAEELAEQIVQISLNAPRVPVLSNKNGACLTTARQIKDDLRAHMTGQVDWVSTMASIVTHAPDVVVEVGPGKVLTGLMMRHNRAMRPLPTSLPLLLERALATLAGDDAPQQQDQAA